MKLEKNYLIIEENISLLTGFILIKLDGKRCLSALIVEKK
jgi:hypothetical protein